MKRVSPKLNWHPGKNQLSLSIFTTCIKYSSSAVTIAINQFMPEAPRNV